MLERNLRKHVAGMTVVDFLGAGTATKRTDDFVDLRPGMTGSIRPSNGPLALALRFFRFVLPIRIG